MELVKAQDVLWRIGRFKIKARLLGRASISAGPLLSPDFQARYGEQCMITVADDLKAQLESCSDGALIFLSSMINNLAPAFGRRVSPSER